MIRGAYGTMYYVANMRASVAYYRKLLGRKPVFESDEWTEFPVGGHRLCLHAKRRGETCRPNGVLILKAGGLKARFASCKRGKLRVSGLHEVHPGHWTFTLRDPSGNELSYYGSP